MLVYYQFYDFKYCVLSYLLHLRCTTKRTGFFVTPTYVLLHFALVLIYLPLLLQTSAQISNFLKYAFCLYILYIGFCRHFMVSIITDLFILYVNFSLFFTYLVAPFVAWPKMYFLVVVFNLICRYTCDAVYCTPCRCTASNCKS